MAHQDLSFTYMLFIYSKKSAKCTISLRKLQTFVIARKKHFLFLIGF